MPAAAVSAALLGGALTRPVAARRAVPAAAAGLGRLVLAGALMFLLPRKVGEVAAVVRLVPRGEQAVGEVELAPPDAARRATAFAVSAWQGGGTVRAELEEVGPGRYVSSRPMPVSGTWKTMVALQRRDEVMAVPVYLPADPEIGAPAVPALPERREAFVRNTELLLREQHDGPAWPAVVGYGGLAGVVALWVGLLALAARRISPEGAAPAAPAPPVPAPAGVSRSRPVPDGDGDGAGDGDSLRRWRESLERMRSS